MLTEMNLPKCRLNLKTDLGRNIDSLISIIILAFYALERDSRISYQETVGPALEQFCSICLRDFLEIVFKDCSFEQRKTNLYLIVLLSCA